MSKDKISQKQEGNQEHIHHKGGMFSSIDFRELVIRSSIDRYRPLFKQREWDKPTGIELIPTIRGRIIIEPFDELNLTPFSYDLSVGTQLISMSAASSEPVDLARMPYILRSRETAVIMTNEFIALPPEYAATAWPRFNVVSNGIFQSMVKIDPTWFGHLAIALTNVSPAPFTLRMGQLFATLIIYELRRPTDITLHQRHELEELRVEVKGYPSMEQLPWDLEDAGLRSLCSFDANTNELVFRGLKKRHFDKLAGLSHYTGWKETIEEAKAKTIRTHTLGMTALGFDKLGSIVDVPLQERLSEEGLRASIPNTTEQDLINVALEYGKPFDVYAAIPEIVSRGMEDRITKEIQTEFGANLAPRMIILMISVIGFLSIVSIIVTYVIGFLRFKDDPALIREIFSGLKWVGGIAGLSIGGAWAFRFYRRIRERWRGTSAEVRSLRRNHKSLSKENSNLKSKLRKLDKRWKKENNALKSKLKEVEKRWNKELKDLEKQIKAVAKSSPEKGKA